MTLVGDELTGDEGCVGVGSGGEETSGGVLIVMKAAVRAFGGQVDVGKRDQV